MVRDESAIEQEPLDKHHARREINRIRQAIQASIFSWAVAAGCTARVLDRGIEGISYPTHYLAKALGLSLQHVRRLRAAGRVLQLVAPLGSEFPKAIENEATSNKPVFTERLLRPLTKLLARPDDLKVAFRRACEAVPDGKRLSSAETVTAVEAILDGGDSPTTRPDARQRENQPDARENVEVVGDDRIARMHAFWQAVADLVEQAQTLPGATTELRAALTTVNGHAFAIYDEARQRASGLWQEATG